MIFDSCSDQSFLSLSVTDSVFSSFEVTVTAALVATFLFLR